MPTNQKKLTKSELLRLADFLYDRYEAAKAIEAGPIKADNETNTLEALNEKRGDSHMQSINTRTKAK